MSGWTHRVLSANESEGTLECANCGVVSIAYRYMPGGVRRPRCSNAKRAHRGSTRKRHQARRGAVCEACGATDVELCADHDHACCPGRFSCTKCFRGTLCQSCNYKLGRVEAALIGLLQLRDDSSPNPPLLEYLRERTVNPALAQLLGRAGPLTF